MSEQGFDTEAYMPKQMERLTPQTQMLMSRQAQEVQMAMYVAKQFPRDTFDAFNRIMKACERPMLAEVAMYEFPRGKQKVTGPSIRLAEEIARAWGNIDFGVLELEQRQGESTAMAYAWDLETNTRQTKVFVVKHERKANGSISKLDDPRDIYEMVANQGARRVRACVLGIIPGDIVEAAVEKCKHTMTTGHKEPLEDRVRKIIATFDKEFQVSQAMLEKYIGCNAAAFSEQDLVRLKSVGRAIRDGMAPREDYFDIRQTTRDMTSDTEKAFQETKTRKAGAKHGDGGTTASESAATSESNSSNADQQGLPLG